MFCRTHHSVAVEVDLVTGLNGELPVHHPRGDRVVRHGEHSLGGKESPPHHSSKFQVNIFVLVPATNLANQTVQNFNPVQTQFPSSLPQSFGPKICQK